MYYTCRRCNFGCIQKNDMRRHLNRKNPCKALYLDITRDSLIEELDGKIIEVIQKSIKKSIKKSI